MIRYARLVYAETLPGLYRVRLLGFTDNGVFTLAYTLADGIEPYDVVPFARSWYNQNTVRLGQGKVLLYDWLMLDPDVYTENRHIKIPLGFSYDDSMDSHVVLAS